MRSARLLLVGGAGILVIASPLFAHGKLLSSDPVAGSRLTISPKTVRLDFSEAAELRFTRVSIVTSRGDTIALVALRHPGDSSRSVIADVPGKLPMGDLRIIWRMASADGHPTRGEILFSIVAAIQPGADSSAFRDSGVAAVRPPITTAPEIPGFGVQSPLYVVIRWLEFCALLTVIGTVAFRNLVLPRIRTRTTASGIDETTRRAAMWGRNAALALAVTAVLRLVAQAVAMGVAGTPMQITEGPGVFLATAWGRAWIVQMVVAVIAALIFNRAGSGRGDDKSARTIWQLATVATLMLAVTPALSGHAAAASRLWGGAIVVDAAHVIGAGGWLGTLLLTLAVGLREPMGATSPDLHAAELFNAFSPVALMFGGLAAITGVTSGWLNLGSFSALVGSSYGKVLLIKLALVFLVGAAGAYNWLRARPALGRGFGTRAIRRSASLEIGLGIAVLLVTAILVAVPTPFPQ